MAEDRAVGSCHPGFRALTRAQRHADALAQVVLIVYLLGRRLGIGFGTIDNRLAHMVRNISGEHELETWYGDLSVLEEYLRSKR